MFDPVKIFRNPFKLKHCCTTLLACFNNKKVFIFIGLNITDCRGQSYGNASNMTLAGKYNGLQARIKMEQTWLMDLTCSAHSLNLVVVKIVECNGRVFDFFTFLKELYNFFSSCTHR